MTNFGYLIFLKIKDMNMYVTSKQTNKKNNW